LNRTPDLLSHRKARSRAVRFQPNGDIVVDHEAATLPHGHPPRAARLTKSNTPRPAVEAVQRPVQTWLGPRTGTDRTASIYRRRTEKAFGVSDRTGAVASAVVRSNGSGDSAIPRPSTTRQAANFNCRATGATFGTSAKALSSSATVGTIGGTPRGRPLDVTP